MKKIPSHTKELNEYNIAKEEINSVKKEHKNKDEIVCKYNHVFRDVYPNASRLGRSYYETHHRDKRKVKVDDESDLTNLRNNSNIKVICIKFYFLILKI